MRYARSAGLPGWILQLGLTVAAASLVLMSAVRAADIKQLTEKLPHAYIGEFLWDGDTTVQNVVITFDKVQPLPRSVFPDALGFTLEPGLIQAFFQGGPGNRFPGFQEQQRVVVTALLLIGQGDH